MGVFSRPKAGRSARAKAVLKSRRALARPAKPLQRRSLSPKTKLAIGIASLMLGASAVRASPHQGSAPNPANQSGVAASRVTAYGEQAVTNSANGFRSLRFSQRATTNGPVIFVEQGAGIRGKPNNVQLGIAQRVALPMDVIAKLGLRTPQLGKGSVEWETSNVGLVLARKGVSAEVHRMENSDATRYTVGSKVGGSVVDASFMGPGYISAERSVRVGVDELEKTLKINLGKLSTSMGLTFPEGRKAKVDVGLFYPTKHGAVGLGAFELPGGEKRVSALLIINF